MKIMEDIELINFIDLSLNQKKMVLTWRNNYEIRKWMYNQDEITLDSHLSFIDNLKTDKYRLYFLVKEKDYYIGIIDFTNITNDSLNIGIYTNPNIYGKGTILLTAMIKYSFDELKVKTIFSEVFKINQKAYSLYKRFGFKDISIKQINNKSLICMELRC